MNRIEARHIRDAQLHPLCPTVSCTRIFREWLRIWKPHECCCIASRGTILAPFLKYKFQMTIRGKNIGYDSFGSKDLELPFNCEIQKK
jgi:hypothetical protein